MFKRFFRWIKRRVTPANKPTGNYGSHGDTRPSFKPVWGFINPHLSRAGGADTYPEGAWDEYRFGLAMKKFHGYPMRTRDEGGVRQATKELVALGVNATIENHKDAYKYPKVKAKGFSVLALKGDELSIKYAKFIVDHFAEKFPDRVMRCKSTDGVKEVEGKTAGAGNLRNAKNAGAEVAVLPELFFIDNPDEWISPEKMAEFWKEVLG